MSSHLIPVYSSTVIPVSEEPKSILYKVDSKVPRAYLQGMKQQQQCFLVSGSVTYENLFL